MTLRDASHERLVAVNAADRLPCPVLLGDTLLITPTGAARSPRSHFAVTCALSFSLFLATLLPPSCPLPRLLFFLFVGEVQRPMTLVWVRRRHRDIGLRITRTLLPCFNCHLPSILVMLNQDYSNTTRCHVEAANESSEVF